MTYYIVRSADVAGQPGKACYTRQLGEATGAGWSLAVIVVYHMLEVVCAEAAVPADWQALAALMLAAEEFRQLQDPREADVFGLGLWASLA